MVRQPRCPQASWAGTPLPILVVEMTVGQHRVVETGCTSAVCTSTKA